MTEVELHIHVKREGKLLLNPERAILLKAVKNSGSLLTASRQTGISYNKAWKLFENMNQTLQNPVIEKLRGGKGGGGATITAFGSLVLTEYEAMEKAVGKFSNKLNIEINM